MSYPLFNKDHPMNPSRHHHPCFNAEAAGTCGRVHLPVAPKCNILCNYCNRKMDCVNESRPGVTSAVLKPRQALAYLNEVRAKMPEITVAGIAGPGDPFANAAETLATIALIRRHHPDLLICLSSNGLGLPAHLDEIAALGVSHVTITVNAVDPAIGAKFYRWVRDGKVILRGMEAACRMLERQVAAIAGLKAAGIAVKVNTIVTPGVNDTHVEDIARTVAGLGADIHNLIALYPTPETPFADLAESDPEMIAALREKARRHLPQMRHCRRCRADAVGLLHDDRSVAMAGCLRAHAAGTSGSSARPHVAVATHEGLLVNRHLGEAPALQIWTRRTDGFACIEERPAPEPGSGGRRWLELAETLKDCRAVLVAAVGPTPRAILEEAGIRPLEMEGLITDGLAAVYNGADTGAFTRRRVKVCRGGRGDGC